MNSYINSYCVCVWVGVSTQLFFVIFLKNVLQIWRHGPVYIQYVLLLVHVVLVRMKCDVYMVESSIMIGG